MGSNLSRSGASRKPGAIQYACAMVLPLIAIGTGDSTVCILTLTAFGSARAGSVVNSVIWPKGDYAERCTAIASTNRATAIAIAVIGVPLALMLSASVSSCQA